MVEHFNLIKNVLFNPKTDKQKRNANKFNKFSVTIEENLAARFDIQTNPRLPVFNHKSFLVKDYSFP